MSAGGAKVPGAAPPEAAESPRAAAGRALRERIAQLVAEYHETCHASESERFVPGETRIPYAGRVYGAEELVRLVDTSLDFWLTAGPVAASFERGLRRYFGSRDFLAVNSGSSANLLMVATLCSPQLREAAGPDAPRPLVPGDEVLTPAVTFPTTLAPLVQHGLVPLFVDCELGTYNVDPALVEAALGPRTRAILVPHTLGNPCDMEVIVDVARRRGLWLLEDGCDALGATFDGKLCGTFGALSSLSFFPAHHITTGEGGGVVVNARGLARTARSLRDWGRDCWCDPGCSDTCGRRFDWQLGALPRGYDHKYTYTNVGYNLKLTEMQAAVGLEQIGRIGSFVAARRRNFARLTEGLRPLERFLLLPRIDPRAEPSPFGFPITVRPGTDRGALVRWLEDAGVETRLVFGGNILKQPGFRNIRRRVHGTLERSDAILARTFFVGVYPGLRDEMIDYVVDRTAAFFAARVGPPRPRDPRPRGVHPRP